MTAGLAGPSVADRLRAAGLPSPDADAADLVVASAGDSSVLESLVVRRLAREPLAHLLGRVRIGGLELLVGPGVFVPQPETLDVAVGALRLLDGIAQPVVVDLCCGGGTLALLVAAARPDATVHAVEQSPDAVRWLRRNVEHTGLPVVAHASDAADALPELDGRVDMVVCNPPYVADHEGPGVAPEVLDHDPAIALFAGSDGLDVIRIVEVAARRLLRPDGLLVVEHSDRQGQSAPALLVAAGWEDVADHRDSEGRDRWVTARRSAG